MSYSWDEYYLEMCGMVSKKSKDSSTQVGCVIAGKSNEIRSIGFNGMPRGIKDDLLPERNTRPEKYKWFEHAERNAIYNAARIGTSLEGCTLYIGWTPCHDCARAIIQSGITRVVIEKSEIPDRWLDSCYTSLCMFKECGIRVEFYDSINMRIDWETELNLVICDVAQLIDVLKQHADHGIIK